MSSVAAFRSVIADPDLEAPRVAFADACEAEGDRTRADFIRLQLEAKAQAALGRDWWTPGSSARELLRGNEQKWAGTLPDGVIRYDFFGGFVERIKMNATEFLARAHDLYRAAPIRRLSLVGVAPVAEELFGSPHLARIVYLVMSHQGLTDLHMEMLASSPHVGKLALLSVEANRIGLAGVEALAASPNLHSLKLVELHSNPASVVQETVCEDQGVIIDAGAPAASLEIERRYGRKTWLHTVEDHGLRKLTETEL